MTIEWQRWMRWIDPDTGKLRRFAPPWAVIHQKTLRSFRAADGEDIPLPPPAEKEGEVPWWKD